MSPVATWQRGNLATNCAKRRKTTQESHAFKITLLYCLPLLQAERQKLLHRRAAAEASFLLVVACLLQP